MTFTGFATEDFATFSIQGLDQRMSAIQNRIQPKFNEIGKELAEHLQVHLGNEMFLHIAKHARRTVNPPDDTWLALANSKRGYKKHPHFQVGLWDDRVFVWLAYIYELPNKQRIASFFMEHFDELQQNLPGHFSISTNHMKKSDKTLNDVSLDDVLTRFERVKSSELLLGRQFAATNPIVADGKALMEETKSVIDTLTPIYQFSLRAVHDG